MTSQPQLAGQPSSGRFDPSIRCVSAHAMHSRDTHAAQPRA